MRWRNAVACIAAGSITSCPDRSSTPAAPLQVAVASSAPDAARAPDVATVRAHAPRCTTTPRAIASDQNGPGLLAVNANNVYWTNQNGGQVMAAPLDGGMARTLAERQHPFGIAVNATHVFWTNNLSRKLGSVMRVAIEGGAATTVAASQGTPYGPALDETSVYWVNAEDGSVAKSAIDGTKPTVLARGQGNPSSIAVAGGKVYWIREVAPLPPPGPTFTREGVRFRPRPPEKPRPSALDVHAISVDGGKPVTLATDSGNARAIAVDSSHVYWTNSFFGKVMTVAIGGGTARAFVSGETNPGELAVDEANVYWIDHPRAATDTESRSSTARIRKAPLQGGGAVTVAAADSALAIAVDARCIYWTEARGGSGSVMTIAKEK